MAKNILPVFRTFPEEGQIIGRLVVGYGVLEFYLICCLGPALGSDDRALRALFRVRSESTRIDVADALMRPPYKEIGLQDKYNEMSWGNPALQNNPQSICPFTLATRKRLAHVCVSGRGGKIARRGHRRSIFTNQPCRFKSARGIFRLHGRTTSTSLARIRTLGGARTFQPSESSSENKRSAAS